MLKLTRIARAVKEALRYWPAPPPVPAAYPGDTMRYTVGVRRG